MSRKKKHDFFCCHNFRFGSSQARPFAALVLIRRIFFRKKVNERRKREKKRAHFHSSLAVTRAYCLTSASIYWTILIWSHKIFYGKSRVGVGAWMDLVGAYCMAWYGAVHNFITYSRFMWAERRRRGRRYRRWIFTVPIFIKYHFLFAALLSFPFHSFCLLRNNKFKASTQI